MIKERISEPVGESVKDSRARWLEGEASDISIETARAIATAIYPSMDAIDTALLTKVSDALKGLQAKALADEALGYREALVLLNQAESLFDSLERFLICQRIISAYSGRITHYLEPRVHGGETIQAPTLESLVDSLVMIYASCGECGQRYKIAIIYPYGATFDEIKSMAKSLVHAYCHKRCTMRLAPTFASMSPYPFTDKFTSLYEQAMRILAFDVPDSDGKTVLPVGPVVYFHEGKSPFPAVS